MELMSIIGLEVHVQLGTKTKMFCGCESDTFGRPPNSVVCPICMGHPGSLPSPNTEAVSRALNVALALGGCVNPSCHFDRKNYFYPDLPSGFQISQYDFPLSQGGALHFFLNNSPRTCRIVRLHLENDAGKLTHTGGTFCDYNRAGVPLIEIVTEPDLRSPTEASVFAQELQRLLITLRASEADMYKGMMRFDASISLRPLNEQKLYPRTEIKNLNSFRALERALTYEEGHLRSTWDEHGPPQRQVTVGWLDDAGCTQILREKESAADYRYFPEPDLPPLSFNEQHFTGRRSALPSLLQQRRTTYAQIGLTSTQTDTLLSDPPLAEYFDVVHASLQDTRRTTSIVLTQLLGALHKAKKSIAEAPPPSEVIALLMEVDRGVITAHKAKEILNIMVLHGQSAAQAIHEAGAQRLTDANLLRPLLHRAIELHPHALADVRAGKTQALGAIVGYVMRETKGQADPHIVQELLSQLVAGVELG